MTGTPPPYAGPSTLAPPPASRAAAGWALGLAFLPVCGIGWLVSVVLSVIVLNKPRDGRDHGRSMAVAALVIDGLWLLAVGTYVALGVATGSADTDTGSSSDGTISVTDLGEGRCFDSTTLNGAAATETVEVGEVEPVPCGQPHQYEVFARAQIPGGTYPGLKEAGRQATALCRDEFGHFVGLSYRRSTLDMVVLHPYPRGWAAGDHRAVCVIGEIDRSRVTGTLHFARR